MRRNAWAGLAVAGLAGVSAGDVIEFTFTGRMDSIGGSVPAPVAVGDTFVFQYRFDSNAPDSDPASNVGLFVGAIERPSLEIGLWQASGLGSGDIGVLDNGFAGDGYAGVVQHPLIYAAVSMTNFGGDAFDSDALPLDLDLADWSLPNFAVEVLVGPAYWNGAGTVTEFSSRVVPGPGVLVTGLLGAAAVRRRRMVG